MKKICRHCSLELRPEMFDDAYQFKRSKFCSRECYQTHHAAAPPKTCVCAHCGRIFESRRTRKFCSRMCRYTAARIDGTEYVSANGYTYVKAHSHPSGKASKGWVLKHRLVAEKILGRMLLPGEHVHHEDGNKWNNRLENLRVVSNSEHQELHWRGYTEAGKTHPINSPESIKKRAETRKRSKSS